MTISTESNRNDYTGNASTTAFPYTFLLPASSDLDVYVDGVLQTSGYTVSGVGAASGGTVTFTTAPGCVPVALVRDVAYTQATNYVENDPFPAETHEDALDKVTMLVQQVKELATRAWRFAAGSPKAAAGYVVDEPIGGRYPRVKSDCTGIEFVCLTSAGTYADPVTTLGDLIRGNDLGQQERLARGAGGTALRMFATNKPDWTLGDVYLLNTTDAQADAGRVFALDTQCNSAFVVSSASGCGRLQIVTPAAVGDDCQANVMLAGGPVTVASSNVVARGQWVRKSATPGYVEGVCATHTQFRPIPKGTLGLALTHSTGGGGNCTTILKLPVPAQGMQGLPTVRRNRSAWAKCVAIDMIADAVIVADACNDVVVIRPAPGNIQNSIETDLTNKKNGRDQVAAFSAGDVHFYWVYEADSGTLYSRSSAKGPETSGPELPVCETHWAYSHSVYWDGNCIRRHLVRGASVFYECLDSTRVLNAGAATCETRISLVTTVPLIATRVRVLARLVNVAGITAVGQALLGYRLNCIGKILVEGSADVNPGEVAELVFPNNNQELFYRIKTTGTASQLTLHVTGYDVPNGDS